MKYTHTQSSKYSLALIALLIPLLPACGPQYQSKTLHPLNHHTAHFEENKTDASLKVRVLNKKDADRLFDGRGRYLFSKKDTIYPIVCSVTNNSSDEVLHIEESHIGLPLASYDVVAGKMKFSLGSTIVSKAEPISYIFCLALVIFGVIGLPLTLLNGCHGSPIVYSAHVAFVGIFGGGTSLLMKSGNEERHEVNESIYSDTADKSSLDKIIAPGKTVNFLFFVSQKDFKPQFTMSVANRHNQTIDFNVDIHQAKNEFVKK